MQDQGAMAEPPARRTRGRIEDRHAPMVDARLYLCTDARRERGDLAEFADAALAGGVDIIQLRDKGSVGERKLGPLEARDELAALEVLADAAARHGALVAVNDRADIARAAGADVLHLGQDDLPLDVAREIVLPGTALGRSTHNIEQATAALASDVDYFCVGPCWPTPTKPGRPAPGLALVRQVAAMSRLREDQKTPMSRSREEQKTPMSRSREEQKTPMSRSREEQMTQPSTKPWFAIGGIDLHRLPEVIDAGARRIVVVRAITAADDPRAAAGALSEALASATT